MYYPSVSDELNIQDVSFFCLDKQHSRYLDRVDTTYYLHSGQHVWLNREAVLHLVNPGLSLSQLPTGPAEVSLTSDLYIAERKENLHKGINKVLAYIILFSTNSLHNSPARDTLTCYLSFEESMFV